MRTILVALNDPELRDQVRTAAKMFPEVRAVSVTRDRVLDLVQDPEVADALIIDHELGRGGHDPFIAEVRRHNREIAILAAATRPDRNTLNKAKMELNVFSVIPLPLDPFDLLRRLHRLVESLRAA